jgi:phenylacetate-coenzyme A ligase PaaK-like adenylate-forming protein
MLKVKGVIVFPSQIEDIIASTPGTVKEAWQIYVDKEAKALSDMTVAVEADPAQQRPGDQIVADIKRAIHTRMGISADVQCAATGSLPRYEAKATRVLHKASAVRAAAAVPAAASAPAKKSGWRWLRGG